MFYRHFRGAFLFAMKVDLRPQKKKKEPALPKKETTSPVISLD